MKFSLKFSLVDRPGCVWITACALLVASLSSCSSDDGPVANTTTNPAPIEPARITYESPLPPPVRITDMACLGAGTGAVCSEKGFVALNEGGTWRVLNTGQSVDLNAVWGTSASDFYVVGNQGCILHWDGAAFTEINTGTMDDFLGVWGSAANDVWICGRTQIVHWDGATPILLDSSTLPASGPYNAVGGTSTTNAYVVGGSGRVQHWDGSAWSLVTTGLPSVNLNSVFVGGNEVFIAGANKILWHFDGTSWSSFTASTTSTLDDFLVITGTGPNRVYAFGQDRLMYRWDGTSWSDIADTFFASTYDIHSACAAGATVVVGGDYQVGPTNIAFYDGGAWSSLSSPNVTSVALWDAWTFNKNHAFAFGDGGTILERDATGWSVVPHGVTTASLFCAWASGSDDLYAAGDVGTVVHYDGGSWLLVNTGLGTRALWDVSGNGPNNIWIVGDGALWHWDGTAWTDRWSELPSLTEDYSSIYVAPGGTVFLAGTNFVRYDGTTWSVVPLKIAFDYIEHIWAASATDIWLTDYLGILHWDGTDAELLWPGDALGSAHVVTGRNGDNVLAAAPGELVQFAAGIPSITPFEHGFGVNGAHTGDDGTAYFVGYTGLIVRVE